MEMLDKFIIRICEAIDNFFEGLANTLTKVTMKGKKKNGRTKNTD